MGPLTNPFRSSYECKVCGRGSNVVSKALGVCLDCIRERYSDARPILMERSIESRSRFSLPSEVPQNDDGVTCRLCANQCRIGEGNRGFCGLRKNEDSRLHHLGGTVSSGLVEWYYDPLPTNCVADWVCPGGTGCGSPEYSHSKNGGPEYGHKNLAVFYGACSYDCKFCQNWHYRKLPTSNVPRKTAHELADAVDDQTSCICYFGGDPSPQAPHALAASKIAIENNPDKILRICWETNGNFSRPALRKAAELSLVSGGCIKVDLKTYDENLNKALCGVTNKNTHDNFELLSGYIGQRPQVPLLIASTLLVPGYIDSDEVSKIARFIAEIDRNIPYSLLGFHPQFEMDDLPSTSMKQALECKMAAKDAGLQNVKLGNVHLLS